MFIDCGGAWGEKGQSLSQMKHTVCCIHSGCRVFSANPMLINTRQSYRTSLLKMFIQSVLYLPLHPNIFSP